MEICIGAIDTVCVKCVIEFIWGGREEGGLSFSKGQKAGEI
jgi:hypothetical protein